MTTVTGRSLLLRCSITLYFAAVIGSNSNFSGASKHSVGQKEGVAAVVTAAGAWCQGRRGHERGRWLHISDFSCMTQYQALVGLD